MAIHEKYRAQYEALRASERREIEALLTPEQRARMQSRIEGRNGQDGNGQRGMGPGYNDRQRRPDGDNQGSSGRGRNPNRDRDQRDNEGRQRVGERRGN